MSALLEVTASRLLRRLQGDQQPVVRDRRPELRAIIGPNGAGKTTFMDIVTGKTRPDEGRVRWGEPSIAAAAVGKPDRAGGHRPQVPAPTVFEDQSVRDNLLMALKKDRAPFAVLATAERRGWRGSRRWPRRSACPSELDRKAGELPRAEAMAGDRHAAGTGPALLLVDEPAAGMTLAEREHTTDLLRGPPKTRAVVVVEHDMEFVRRLDCKVTVLHEGSVLAEGSLDHVTANRGDRRLSGALENA
jgi:urea transport system ATP-binding protein